MNNKLNTNDSLEQLLQNEADKLRMYPSDKVWDNIRVEMHGKTKWSALTLIFALIVGALFTITALNYPPKNLLDKPVSEKFQSTTSYKFKQNAINQYENKKNKQNFNNRTLTHSLKKIFQKNNSYSNNTTIINHKLTSKSDITHDLIATSNDNIYLSEKVSTFSFSKPTIQNQTNTIEVNNVLSKTDNYLENGMPVVTDNTIAIANKPELIKSVEAEKYLKQFEQTSTTTTRKKWENSRWKLQAYLTPSVSYRTLDDDKSRLFYTTNQADRQALNSNVNDVVKQKAALGGEFGVSVMYGVTKKLFIKSGLQFNIRQYGIDAYRTSGQATFAYVQNNQLNIVSFQSAYTTKEGVNATKLENELYQISMPIGLQWNAFEGSRWGLSIAASVQPTYTLNKNVYVISTDYKFYADGTPFFRRWNLNTSTELYLTLKSKNMQWFVGPQVRYQQMPTYNDIYPIKEYRVDYGIKFGFIKSLH